MTTTLPAADRSSGGTSGRSYGRAPDRAAGSGSPEPIEVELLADLLDGRWSETRRAARRLSADPRFSRPEEATVAEHRDRVMGQLHDLAGRGWSRTMLPEHLGGPNDPGANLAAFEELVAADPSLQIKAGVQWGLFASAILHLGTDHHHRTWLQDVMSLRIPGAFAMTEIGHGSDVASLGTTATYDPDAEEFEIHTPFPAATKEYLGNAARDGIAAVVFAQLITGGVNHGVHCFFVPIRDRHGTFLPGVTGADSGVKGGLNGVDNGRLAFDHVRVPRTHLLNRYGSVAADGTYSSDIESPGRRFFTMLSTLVQGRVSLDGAAVRASALALTIAIAYGNQRRQFPDEAGTGEVTLLDYQLHQSRLLPALAETYASAFAHEELLTAFHEVFSGAGDTADAREDLETLAAALKPTSTWLALDTIQQCREACGGAGYLARNRFTGLHDDLDVFATFEGDNHVLLQLVAKRLLGDHAKELRGLDRAGLARFVAARAETLSTRHTPWRRLAQSARDVGDVRRSAASLRDGKLQIELLTDRARTLIEELTLALRPATSMDPAEAAELVGRHQVEMIEAARAHADLIRLSAFNSALERLEEGPTRQALERLRDLFALTRIEEHLAWYLMHGHLSMGRARTLRGYINRLLAKLRPHAQDLVAAFGYDQSMLRAELSSGVEQERQEETADHLRRLRARGDAPIDERVLLAQRRASAAGGRRGGSAGRGDGRRKGTPTAATGTKGTADGTAATEGTAVPDRTTAAEDTAASDRTTAAEDTAARLDTAATGTRAGAPAAGTDRSATAGD